ncbi:MAG TPA: hypothetical protein DEO43_01690 [Halieaceae bacterium]|nr:hypothetical protein [Halieaceae bacterium]
MSRCSLLFAFVILVASAAQAIESWVECRDEGVVQQSLDYSRVAASVATQLTYELGRSTSEQEILQLWLESVQEAGGRDDGLLHQGLSYAEMSRVIKRLGFAPSGVAIPLELVPRLKHPVIIYFEAFGQPHFSVLRSANSRGIELADPSWGTVFITYPELSLLLGGSTEIKALWLSA